MDGKWGGFFILFVFFCFRNDVNVPLFREGFYRLCPNLNFFFFFLGIQARTSWDFRKASLGVLFFLFFRLNFVLTDFFSFSLEISAWASWNGLEGNFGFAFVLSVGSRTNWFFFFFLNYFLEIRFQIDFRSVSNRFWISFNPNGFGPDSDQN